MNRKAHDFTVVLVVILALVCCIPSLGQVVRGSISGSVTDPQGAVVSGAKVTAKNAETGTVSTTTSDSSGLFRFNLLQVGTYTVEITSQGFKKASQGNLVVAAGRDTGLGTVKLTVGEATTTMEITTDAPLIEATQSQISATFSGTQLSSFAGVQENEGLDQLALFLPGINATRSDNFSN